MTPFGGHSQRRLLVDPPFLPAKRGASIWFAGIMCRPPTPQMAFAVGTVSFAVMELLQGETLRSRLSHGAIPWRKAVVITVAVADGLAAAHSKGIIHRDLKPENIFLTSDGRVKILDFGLARWKPAVAASGDSAAPTESREDTVLGTVGYMSPEQIRGIAADPPSDIFSLGCVLHEVVTGHRAFSRPTAPETMTAILNEDPPNMADSGVEIPRELQGIINHCLEKNPEQRFQSARDLSFALQAAGGSSGAGLPAGSGDWRKRLKRLIWAGGRNCVVGRRELLRLALWEWPCD
jgi:eukaryotic-like serine/threonine-protein kinase